MADPLDVFRDLHDYLDLIMSESPTELMEEVRRAKSVVENGLDGV